MKHKRAIAWYFGVIVIIAALFSGIILFLVYFQDGLVESKFKKEASDISEISAHINNTFEGGTFAYIQIPNKGSISLVYGLGGLEYITHIGDFDTVFICPENHNVGISFSLRKNGKFQKWFPFQVNNLKELVDHYDDIIAILNTLPHSADPNYTIDTKTYQGNKVTCSIYRASR